MDRPAYPSARLPGTESIFFLIGPAADGYLASLESERDFVSNAEKMTFQAASLSPERR